MNKYGYKEVRTLNSSDLRALCIRQDWYTCGDNEEYCNLFSMTEKENITTDDIVEIATDIFEHSNIERIRRCTGSTDSEIMTAIMFEIGRACYTFFVEA